jgi:hypothetical protein
MTKEQFDILKRFLLEIIENEYSDLKGISTTINDPNLYMREGLHNCLAELTATIHTIEDYIKLYQSLDDVFGHYDAIQEELESLNE